MHKNIKLTGFVIDMYLKDAILIKINSILLILHFLLREKLPFSKNKEVLA